jgi:phosphoglucan,water dikinase
MSTRGFRIGIQTAFSAAEPLQPFYFALRHGFEAFEWFADKKPHGGWHFDDMDGAARRQLRRRGERAGIAFTVHAPWDSSPLSAEGRRSIIRSIDFARDVGARLVNFHLCLEQGAEALASAVAELARYAADARVRLALENTPATGPEQCNEAFRAWRSVLPEPAEVGLCLDVGHANLHSATRNDYIGFLDRLDPRLPIVHLHLHENYGDYDSHLLVFTGPSRDNSEAIRSLLERLQRRGFEGVMILEQWPEPPELLLEARRRLRELLEQMPPLPDGAGRREPRPAAVEDEPGFGPEQGLRTANAPSAAGEQADQTQRSELTASEVAFARAIAQMSAQRRSWRLRLQWIVQTLADPAVALGPSQLAYLAIYLRFLGTGAVACEEDGGHHRPTRHANAALAIEEALLRLDAPWARPLVRSILPWLPSHAAAFRRGEPLTRIRDIAHRSDIPKQLKQQIKHTLQNKLHRSAGPEDLATSARILRRITAPDATYSPAFVEQFKMFHAELEEFFNARSLDEDLRAVRSFAAPALSATISQLLEQRPGTEHGPAALDRQLELLVRVRQGLQPAFGAVGDARWQRMRLADIKLEERAFVLLSERINQLEAEPRFCWDAALHQLILAVNNVAWLGPTHSECTAIGNALRSWGAAFNPADRDELLRLRATLDRTLRLTADYADAVLALLPSRVQLLGRLLGVSEQQLRFFCEADIRRSVVFQLSKLAALMLSRVRAQAGMAPAAAVVAGTVTGTLIELECLDHLPHAGAPWVLLLQRAEGDEEIPAGVRGVVLHHDIPHLSHLGIRARQDNVVMATAAAGSVLPQGSGLMGQRVRLTVSADAVRIESAGPAESCAGAVAPSRPAITEVRLARAPVVLPLARADLVSSGAKATACRALLELSARDDAGFSAPAGCVVPFGVLQSCLSLSPPLWQQYQTLVRRLDEPGAAPDLLARLQQLVGQAPIPESLVQDVLRQLPDASLLMVRSSANGEDLEGFSAAGLYESVAGVTPARLPQAIREVWASLWSRRAVLSRSRAGIPHTRICMAVLIQEAVAADVSFVLHTLSPFAAGRRRAYAELALGLGETLCRASVAGTPYRVVLDLEHGGGDWIAFASYSQARLLADGGGVRTETVDYSQSPLSSSRRARQRLAARLGQLARFVQDAFGAPQNVEGALAGELLHVLQTRPQSSA